MQFAQFFNRSNIWLALICLLDFTFSFNARINSIFVILLCIHWLIYKNLLKKIKSLKTKWQLIVPFWIFFLLHLLSIKDVLNDDALGHTLEVKLSFIIFPLLFSTENYLNKKNLILLFKLFTVSCILTFLYCLLYYFKNYYPSLGIKSLFNRMYFSFPIMHPGYLSNFFVMSYIYLCLSFLYGFVQSKKDIILSCIAIFINALAIFILVSKTALIVFACFNLYFIWAFLGKYFTKKTRIYLFLFSSILITILFFQIPNIQYRFAETKNDFIKTDRTVMFANSTGSRIAAWSLEWDIIKQKPMIGHGTGNSNYLLFKTFLEKNYTDLAKNNMHTHNQIFHTWIDLGILGVLSLLYFFTTIFYYFIQRKNKLGIWFSILLLINCITDDALEIQAIIVFCMFFITLLLFMPKSTEKELNLTNN